LMNLSQPLERQRVQDGPLFRIEPYESVNRIANLVKFSGHLCISTGRSQRLRTNDERFGPDSRGSVVLHG
jgi:pSer/pThr/pTyr-binding forkhead associated (FHA) protein